MMARLGLVALGILVALALAEGIVRVAATFDPRVRVLATGRATRPAVTYATLEQFIAAQAAHITPHRRWYNYWSNAFGFHDEEFVEPKPDPVEPADPDALGDDPSGDSDPGSGEASAS